MNSSVLSRVPEHLAIDAKKEIQGGAEWLKEYMHASGLKKVVLGISGGIDSAVAAMWAARALGEENVIMVAMPYGLLSNSLYASSTQNSLDDARRVAAALPGALFLELDIASTVDAEATTVGLVEKLSKDPHNPRYLLALGNIKARARAVRLRYFANMESAIVLGTENRTENLFGYFTIGGDEETDLEMLSEYLKTEVRQLAVELGVPSQILDKAPSADLWNGQTDEGELGFTYAEADQVLYATNGERSALVGNIDLSHISPEVLEGVFNKVEATAFKRAGRPVYPRNL